MSWFRDSSDEEFREVVIDPVVISGGVISFLVNTWFVCTLVVFPYLSQMYSRRMLLNFSVIEYGKIVYYFLRVIPYIGGSGCTVEAIFGLYWNSAHVVWLVCIAVDMFLVFFAENKRTRRLFALYLALTYTIPIFVILFLIPLEGFPGKAIGRWCHIDRFTVASHSFYFFVIVSQVVIAALVVVVLVVGSKRMLNRRSQVKFRLRMTIFLIINVVLWIPMILTDLIPNLSSLRIWELIAGVLFPLRTVFYSMIFLMDREIFVFYKNLCCRCKFEKRHTLWGDGDHGERGSDGAVINFDFEGDEMELSESSYGGGYNHLADSEPTQGGLAQFGAAGGGFDDDENRDVLAREYVPTLRENTTAYGSPVAVAKTLIVQPGHD